MFNSFPRPVPDGKAGIPSPLDWSAYTTVYDWIRTSVTVPATSYGTFLDITGEGFLLFARSESPLGGAINPDMRITVDGVAYVFQGVNAGAAEQGNVLVNPVYYKSSLKIEVFNRAGSSAGMCCDYTYLSKISNPSKIQTLLNTTSRKMAYGTNATTVLTDVANITGSGYLLSIEFSGFYVSAGTTVNGTMEIDSVTKMNNRPTLFNTTIEGAKQHVFIGPIRFASSFKVQHKVNAAGSTAVTRVWYILD